ncbi:hypothetical protein [Massilia sp. MB5]|uniref:hypothetical protein n=1 Tax=Massilia sp. MB5 TaxID=2919578 RepID=UPI0027D998C4|nr:hypothetical protein [Massilia sp. MB5]
MKFTNLAVTLMLTWGCASALAAPPAAPAAPDAPTAPATPALPDGALPAPSSTAQKLYSAAKKDLLQVRSLLKSGRTQSSVGSGFLVGTSNLVLTNYHVVSQFALDPETYTGEWVDTSASAAISSCWRSMCCTTWPWCASTATAPASSTCPSSRCG